MGIERVLVTVMSGAEDGKIFELSKTPFKIGRHPEDDVLLPYDTRVSRHHAQFTREGSVYFIEDIGPEAKGSSNGTYLNDRKIVGKTAVSSGEIVLLGNVWIKFQTK